MIKKSNFVLKRISTIIEEDFPSYYEKTNYIQTSLRSLDRELKGGLNTSDITILASKSTKINTAFYLNLTSNIAIKQNLPVIIFSLGNNSKDLYNQLLLINKNEKDKVSNSNQKIYNAPIYINENTSLSVKDIKKNIDIVKKIHNNVGLIIIDPLYLMDIKIVSTFFRNIKSIAREENTPVIITTKIKDEKEINKSSLINYDSLRIIYDASDNMLFLSESNSNEKNIFEITFRDSINKIKISFNTNNYIFSEVA
ncbi:MAG: DnaB-like helicase C-terminal domain-containing protein [Candidatus Sericytochromatia bacterium]